MGPRIGTKLNIPWSRQKTPLEAHLGQILGPCWTKLGPKLGQIGAKLGQDGTKLGQVGDKLDQVGRSWGQVGTMLVDFSRKLAITTQGYPTCRRKSSKMDPKSPT